jgi:hypothetical protein
MPTLNLPGVKGGRSACSWGCLANVWAPVSVLWDTTAGYRNRLYLPLQSAPLFLWFHCKQFVAGTIKCHYCCNKLNNVNALVFCSREQLNGAWTCAQLSRCVDISILVSSADTRHQLHMIICLSLKRTPAHHSARNMIRTDGTLDGDRLPLEQGDVEYPKLELSCKIWGFYGGDYEECLLGYRNPVRTSQETHYFSAT